MPQGTAPSLILIRHTRIRSEGDRCYGQTDVPLADTFGVEAAEILRQLPAGRRLVTSPLQRCWLLAKRIEDESGLAPETDDRLMEMDFGDWENRRWADIPRQEVDAWNDDLLNGRPHGGESLAMLEARTAAVLEDCRAGLSPCLVVTHGGVIRAAQRLQSKSDDWPPTVPFGAVLMLD